VDRQQGARAPAQITRYENRKLYDAVARGYVTLEQLRARVVGGEDLEVLDQKTGEDLTTLTLAQILLEGLRGTTAAIPRLGLTHLIRLAWGRDGRAGESPGPAEAAARARQEAERIAGGLLAKGRLTLDEAAAFRHELGRSVHEIVHDAQTAALDRLRGLFAPSLPGPRTALHGLDERLTELADQVKTRARRKKPRPRGTVAARRT
jgi:polyhydroxyalkanoate synthesis regulator phasin